MSSQEAGSSRRGIQGNRVGLRAENSSLNNVRCVHQRPGQEQPNRKRLFICCDGTWNNTNTRGDPASNVSRLSSAIARSCCSGMPQIIYYHPGAGTEEASWVAAVRGGAFGDGVPQDIAECYRFICDNYRTQDELFFLGFSRGAFTVRSVAGLVCSLGFLNRAGINQLPHIFRDYCGWWSWTDTSQFDPDIHLVGFTAENKEKNEKLNEARGPKKVTPRLPWGGNKQAFQEKLKQETRDLFNKIVQINRDSPLDARIKVPEAYREELAKHELVKLIKEKPESKPASPLKDKQTARRDAVQNGPGDPRRESSTHQEDKSPGRSNKEAKPVVGVVRAIGVWDTVGSLGIPKTPITRNSSRHSREIEFESLDVHPNVEYAFHAIALDEWRTAFRPTMWGKARNNTTTQLRQVWFPGSHGNVGGGWEDQQIATIALAWMADQLTPLGVEFSRPEMERIFYAVNPGVRIREWGMGVIRNPSGLTTYFDRVYNKSSMPFHKLRGSNIPPVRTPRMYKAEGCFSKCCPPPSDDTAPSTGGRIGHRPKVKANASNTPLLRETNELVHPCARIRLFYGGFDMDDKGNRAWDCPSLLQNGWQLKFRDAPPYTPRPGGRKSNIGEYLTVAGPVCPYYGDKAAVKGKLEGKPPVKVEGPLHHGLKTKVPDAKYKWHWSRNIEDNDGTGIEHEMTLEEEQIGIWEQRFIDINEQILEWQRAEVIPVQKPWFSFDWHFFRGTSVSDPLAAPTPAPADTVAATPPATDIPAITAGNTDRGTSTVGTTDPSSACGTGASPQYTLRQDLEVLGYVKFPDGYKEAYNTYGLRDVITWENWTVPTNKSALNSGSA